MAVVMRLTTDDVMSIRPWEVKLFSALKFIAGTGMVEAETVVSNVTVKAAGVTRAERGNNLNITVRLSTRRGERARIIMLSREPVPYHCREDCSQFGL
jgi:hypothetical protein